MSPGQDVALRQVDPLGSEGQWVLGNSFTPGPDTPAFSLFQHLGTTWAAYEALQILRLEPPPYPSPDP